jgi:folate-binding protein YgfZ
MKLVPLTKRCIIEISGDDAYDFLQQIITVDVHKLSPENALWGGLLSPQGKYLFDFFLYYAGDSILIDIDKNSATAFTETLQKYILRSKVTIERKDKLKVIAFWHDDEHDSENICPVWFEKHQIVTDPRISAMGCRWVGQSDKADNFMHQYGEYMSSSQEYYAHRIKCGVIDPCEDMLGIDFYLPEINAEKFNGVDYQKGCYVGQEVTARLKHKDALKKQIVSVRVMGNPDLPALLETDIQEIGTLVAYSGSHGLAYVRLDRWQHTITTLRSITAGSTIVYKTA